jgi:hypothetical protein
MSLSGRLLRSDMKLQNYLLVGLTMLLSACSQDPDTFSTQCIGNRVQLGTDFVQADREERRTYKFKNQQLDNFVCHWSKDAIYCSQLQPGLKTELIIKRTYPSIVSEIQAASEKQSNVFLGKCESQFKSL